VYLFFDPASITPDKETYTSGHCSVLVKGKTRIALSNSLNTLQADE